MQGNTYAIHNFCLGISVVKKASTYLLTDVIGYDDFKLFSCLVFLQVPVRTGTVKRARENCLYYKGQIEL